MIYPINRSRSVLKNLLPLYCLLAVTGLLFSCTSNTRNEKVLGMRSDIIKCGTVQFSEGCTEELDSFIAYGIALVHHMTYDEAEKVFDDVITADPDCFWGHWGKALTYIHPLWPDEPTEEKLKAGLSLSEKALSLAEKPRETEFGTALVAFYKDGIGKTQKERLKNFAAGWESAYHKLPDDQEAKAFHALTLISTADPTDKTYQKQLKAGQLAEEVLKKIPDHPGSFHYMIHAYDYPELANQALHAAGKYDKLAPNVPHALHMPTHIYTRLGMWKESIDWNIRSAKAAFASPVRGAVSTHYFHALDYLVYAYLQVKEDQKARQILADIKNLKGTFQDNPAAAYTLAAVDARVALERKEWEKAAALLPRMPSHFPWDRFPEYEALSHFAIGLGAARSNNIAKAEAAIQRLDELQAKVQNPYWKEQVEIQKNTINAWLALAKGNKQEALSLMTLAAKKETATSKHPVTPGELLPASELLGDLLMELKKPAEAIAQYELALQRSPGRLNSISGAAMAARMSGNKQKEKYFNDSLEKLLAGTSMPLAKN